MSCIPINDFSLITLNDAGKAGTPGKLYSIVPSTGDGDFDVTRAGSAATRVNAQGLIETVPAGMPRIDFEPVTGEYLGTLVEPQRVNYFINTLNLSLWQAQDPTQASTSPFSYRGLTGILYENITSGEGSVANTKRIQFTSNIPLSQNDIFTISTFVKKTATSGKFQQRVGGLSFIQIDTSDFSVINNLVDYDLVGIKLHNLNSSEFFIRMTFVRTATGTISTLSHSIALVDEFSSMIFAGYQVEFGNGTSLIPTNGSALTRDADVITRTNAADLIGQGSGTIRLEANLQLSNTARTIAEFYEDADNYINIRKNASNEIVATAVKGGSTVLTVTSAVQTAGVKKITLAYQTGTCTLTVNGVDTTATATDIPDDLDTIRLGARQDNSEFWNSHIKLIAAK